MRLIVIVALTFTLNACAMAPQYPQFPGGQKITQAGYSFIAPANKSWTVLVQSTYQITLGTKGDNPNETLIASVSTFQIPTFSSPQDFLSHVRSARAAEPQTGRFEVIKNDEQLYAARSETCVKHEMESKNFGAKRGNDYTVIEYFGMNCIQLSRKAPPGIEYPRFKTMGSQLLKSVEFRAYR
jgi:hypothetical protein